MQVSMKSKYAICSLLIIISSIMGLSFLSGAYETMGDDKEVTDNADDVILVDDVRSFSTESTETTDKYPYVDMKTLTIAETGANFTITVGLKDNYNHSATFFAIVINLDINGSELSIGTQSYFTVNITTISSANLSRTMSSVKCVSSTGTYTQGNISTVSGKTVTWMFPKTNVTELVPNNKSISEWRVEAYSFDAPAAPGSYQGAIDEIGIVSGLGFDFDFNFDIPGYPLLFLATISIGSIVILIRKEKNS